MGYKRKHEYQQYLKSYKWRKKREQILKRDNYRCISCNSPYNLVVHHVWYPKVFGEETDDMLQTLCETCHNVKCHNGSLSKSKNRLPKVVYLREKRRRKRNKRMARYNKDGPIRLYNKEEIAAYSNEYAMPK